MKIHILNPDGTTIILPVNKEPTLEELQTIVGGHIERVVVKFNNETTDMIINEEGKIHNLPINKTATNIYNNIPDRVERTTIIDVIVGTAVIFEGFRLS